MINEKMTALGKKSSVIRAIFEYSKVRKAQIGDENVFDFSIGNPSIPAPQIVQAGVLIVDIATITEGILRCSGRCCTAVVVIGGKIAPSVILVGNLQFSCGIVHSNNIALQVLAEVVFDRCGQVAVGILLPHLETDCRAATSASLSQERAWRLPRPFFVMINLGTETT